MKNKIIILFIILILSLTACNAQSENAVEGTTETMLEASSQAVVEIEQPVTGGTLSLSMHSPKTLNPLLNEDVTVDKALKLVFEPLFVLNSEQEVVPNLAEAYLLSPDGLTMAITLKAGQTWHDGSEITADDIIFSLDTIKNASSNSVYKNVMKNVSGYTKSSKTTVVINYSAPYGGCEYSLCFPIIPEHYYRGGASVDSNVSLKPLGNGLFEFDSYRLAREMKLKKSSNFRGTPYIDFVEVVVMPDENTELSALEQGVIDVLEMDLSRWGKFNSATSVSDTSFNSNQFEFLGFNFSKPMFTNKNVRQAIAYSVPYSDIVSNIYLNNALESITPINPGSWLSALTGVEGYEYDIERAKEVIQSTGLSTSEMTFSILVNEENSERVEIAGLIAENLNQLGMTVTVDKQPFEVYKTKLDTDQFDLFVGGIELESKLDISKLLASSSQTSPGINYFNFSDLQMDTLINACLNAKDEEEYKNAISEAQRYCSRQLPLVGLCFKSSILVTNDRVKGVKIPVVGNIYSNIEDWYIDDNIATSDDSTLTNTEVE